LQCFDSKRVTTL